MAPSSRWPNTGPTLARNGVCDLPTTTCDPFASLFAGVGSISTRISGASISVPVIGSTVRAGRFAKLSA